MRYPCAPGSFGDFQVFNIDNIYNESLIGRVYETKQFTHHCLSLESQKPWDLIYSLEKLIELPQLVSIDGVFGHYDLFVTMACTDMERDMYLKNERVDANWIKNDWGLRHERGRLLLPLSEHMDHEYEHKDIQGTIFVSVSQEISQLFEYYSKLLMFSEDIPAIYRTCDGKEFVIKINSSKKEFLHEMFVENLHGAPENVKPDIIRLYLTFDVSDYIKALKPIPTS